MGKLNEEKDQPLLITLKEEEKKRQLFQNLNKIRDAGEPFNKVIITHDLTKRQKDELKQLVEQAKEKEKEDQYRGIHVSCKRTTMELVYKEDTQEKVERSN